MRKSRDLEAALGEAVRYSDAMLTAAADERWEIVAAYEADRRIVLNQIFADASGGEKAGRIAAAIDQVQHMDARLTVRLQAARDACGQTLQGLHRGTVGVQAYAGVAVRQRLPI